MAVELVVEILHLNISLSFIMSTSNNKQETCCYIL